MDKRSAVLLMIVLLVFSNCLKQSSTVVEIKNNNWYINNVITFEKTPAKGLLLNTRMVNCTFADIVKKDFSADLNTSNFIQSIELYKQQGVRAFTLNMQGGMPGYEGAVNSAYLPDGQLDNTYLARMEKVIKACDRQGIVVILGCFYQRQDQVLKDEKAVKTALLNTCKWIKENSFTNVVLEVANEFAHRGYDHEIIKTVKGELELIELAKSVSNQLLVSTSGMGNGKIDPQIAQKCDFILIHFNSTPVDSIPARIKQLQKYNKPVVCNEDDKTGQQAVNAMRASIENGISWGYMNNKVNQYYPFEFNGKMDDELVYNAMADISHTPMINTKTNNVIADLEHNELKTLDALQPTSGAIIVSKGSDILYEKYFTGTVPQQPFTGITENSLWPLFSCTKSYISALLLNLMADSILKLDEPVGLYLKAFRSKGNGSFDRRDVTIRQLASHTSGAFYPTEAGERLICTPPLDLLKVDIVTKPGEVFLYSTLGMHILERVIESATGQDLETLLTERILGPLHLDHTKYIYNYTDSIPLLPCIAGDFQDEKQHFAFVYKGDRCSSGLYTTAREFNRFGQLMASDGTFEGHQFFNKHDKIEIWKYHGTRDSDNGRYGLLWWLFEDQGGYVMSGAGNVVNAVIPDSKVVVTVMRNHIGPYPGPFDYFNNKKALVEFGKKLE